MASFDDTFTGDRNRRTKYRQWSEAAVVIGVNADTLSFDIVVTSKVKSGNDVRLVNRTIRNVKTLQGFREGLFAVGDSVLIGYIQEKREHPIILGFGDNVNQRAVEVTLPDGTDPAIIEGENLFEPIQQPACDFRLQDVETGTTNFMTIDCGNLDIANCSRAPVRAVCGCGKITWTASNLPAGYTDSDFLQPFGGGNSHAKLCMPTNIGSGEPGTAYNDYRCFVVATGSNACNFRRIRHLIGCDDVEDSNTNSCSAAITTCPDCCRGAPAGCDGIGDEGPCNGCTPFGAYGDTFESVYCAKCGQCSDCQPSAFFCGEIEDVRTPTQISNGCVPCGIAGEILLTATDQCGQAITVPISVIP